MPKFQSHSITSLNGILRFYGPVIEVTKPVTPGYKESLLLIAPQIVGHDPSFCASSIHSTCMILKKRDEQNVFVASVVLMFQELCFVYTGFILAWLISIIRRIFETLMHRCGMYFETYNLRTY